MRYIFSILFITLNVVFAYAERADSIVNSKKKSFYLNYYRDISRINPNKNIKHLNINSFLLGNNYKINRRFSFGWVISYSNWKSISIQYDSLTVDNLDLVRWMGPGPPPYYINKCYGCMEEINLKNLFVGLNINYNFFQFSRIYFDLELRKLFGYSLFPNYEYYSKNRLYSQKTKDSKFILGLSTISINANYSITNKLIASIGPLLNMNIYKPYSASINLKISYSY